MSREKLHLLESFLRNKINTLETRTESLIDLGNSIGQINERDAVYELHHLIEWIEKAKEMGFDNVKIDFGKNA